MAKIEFKNVNYIYNQKTSKETRALCDVNLKIDDGEFLAIIGHTGSGKSTLIQLMDGLLKGATGEILVDDKNIEDKDFLRALITAMYEELPAPKKKKAK